MRVSLDPDVYAEIERLHRESGLDENDALNTLVRRGMKSDSRYVLPYVNVTHDMGNARMDITCIGEVLSALDEEEWRR